MADDVKSLLIRVDATTELLRGQMKQAEAAVGDFDQAVEQKLNKLEQRFSGLNTGNLTNSLKSVEKEFQSSFNNIQKIAAQAIEGPRLKSGDLDLGVVNARAAADQARKQAAAIGIIADAASRAASAEGNLSRENQIFVQAAEAARTKANLHADALEKEAGALERLQIEMRAAGGGAQALALGQNRATVSAGQLKAGSQQLAYNISDVAVSFAGGINPMIIFAQQGSQVVQAIALMRAESTGLIGFLGGPWGAVILGAVSVIGVMATKHNEAAAAEGEHKKAADALKEAVDRLTNASASLNHETEQGIRDDIAAANAKRALTRETLNAARAKLVEAQAKIKEADAVADKPGNADGGLNFGTVAGAVGERRVDALQGQIIALDRELIAQSKAVVIGQGKLVTRQVAARNDPREAAEQRYTDTTDRAQRAFEKDGNSSKLQGALDRATKERDAALKTIQDGKKKGTSSETIAKREEAARQKVLADDISYNDQERQARRKLLDATARTTASEAERDAILREDINVEADAQKTKISLQRSQGKITQAEAEHLLDINERTRLQRLQNVDIERQSQTIADQAAAQDRSLSVEIALLQIQQDLASTTAERRRLAEQILAKEQQQARLRIQQVIDDPKSSDNAKSQARIDLAARPAIEAGQRAQVDRSNEDALSKYRREIADVGNSLDERFSEIKVRGLESLNDGLTDAIMNAKSFGDVFKNVAQQIIGDLIRIAIQQTIVNSLAKALGGIFGSIGGGGGSGGGEIVMGGAFNNFAGARANGGPVTGGKTYLVGENGPELWTAPNHDLAALKNGSFRSPSTSRATAAAAAATQSASVVKIEIGEGGLFEARVTGISGKVSAQVLATAAPTIIGAAAARANDGAVRSARRTIP